MLTAEDLKQIGDLMDVKLDQKLDQKLDEKIGEVLEAVNKGFSEVQVQIDDLRQDVSVLKHDVSGLKQDVMGVKATMVTKDYLDEKLGLAEARQSTKTRKLERKVDIMTDTFVERGMLTTADVQKIENARVYPRLAP